MNYGFTNVMVKTYKSDADGIDSNEPSKAEKNSMESSRDFESFGQREPSDSYTIQALKLSTEKELLSESREDAEITLTEAYSSNNSCVWVFAD